MIKRFFYCFTSANLSNRNKKGSWDLFMGVDRKALKSDSVSYAKCGFYWYVESCKSMHASHTWQENNTYLMRIVWDLNMRLIKRQKAFTSQEPIRVKPSESFDIIIIIIMLCCSHRLSWLSGKGEKGCQMTHKNAHRDSLSSCTGRILQRSRE